MKMGTVPIAFWSIGHFSSKIWVSFYTFNFPAVWFNQACMKNRNQASALKDIVHLWLFLLYQTTSPTHMICILKGSRICPNTRVFYFSGDYGIQLSWTLLALWDRGDVKQKYRAVLLTPLCQNQRCGSAEFNITVLLTLQSQTLLCHCQSEQKSLNVNYTTLRINFTGSLTLKCSMFRL
jgi:hypothetical protein